VKNRLLWPVLLALAALLVLPLVITGQSDGLVHVSFLNVGQGDAILISQGDTQILVDGGPSPQALLAELGKRVPFWDHKIELVVLTHPHADHLAGLVEVLQRYQVGQVLAPPETVDEAGEYDAALVTEWRQRLVEKAAPLLEAQAGQEFHSGQIVLAVLNPPATPYGDDTSSVDDNSVVLYLHTGTVSFLLTGDISTAAEHELVMRRLLPQVTVLKVAHHGSENSTGAEFLAVARPQIAVISVGVNRYGHPGPDTLSRLGKTVIYRTDREGTVEFATDGNRLWLS
jgi:competence protein ComEC